MTPNRSQRLYDELEHIRIETIRTTAICLRCRIASEAYLHLDPQHICPFCGFCANCQTAMGDAWLLDFEREETILCQQCDFDMSDAPYTGVAPLTDAEYDSLNQEHDDRLRAEFDRLGGMPWKRY